MTTSKKTLRLLALGAAASVLLTPYAADSGTCSDAAARNLLGASYLDGLLNLPDGEDLEFLYREGGFPNIMVLFDTSGSMQMLPPDGAGKIGGPSSTQPTGYPITNPTSTGPAGACTATSGTQKCAFAATPASGMIVGCGLDPISSGTVTWAGTQTIQGIQARTFRPPCGQATNAALLGAPYQGHGIDYAASMTVCPYFTSSNNQAVGAPGYDPDFYNSAGPTDTTKNGAPVFFGKDLVFHDNAYGTDYAYVAGVPTLGNLGDGWSDTAVFPWKKSNAAFGTIAEFCAAQGTALQGAQTRAQICNTCLTNAGWYYDGMILDPNDTSYAGKRPSLWYTGNYLNFFPPKFVAARKVMKDIISVQSRIRMGMASFDATGAKILQPFNPTCGMPDGSNFDSNRASYIGDINNSTKLDFENSTPLASALFDIGRYYHSPDLPWFGASWENTSKESSGTANQAAICFSCQVSSVIVLTDGQPSGGDGDSLPAGASTLAQADGGILAGAGTTGIRGITAATCPQCDSFSGSNEYMDNMAKVAWYLHNFDLRKNSETTADCKGQPGKQTIQTYTLGFATGQLPNANTILRNTAEAGGGVFVGAEDPSQLREGISYIISEISNRSTSFSVATISTLQTTSGRAVIVPRFDPNKTAHWKGHLFRFDLYSEFVNKCTPNGLGDLDCDGLCNSTFLQDNSGNDGSRSLISEDGNGSFVRNEPVDKPVCAQAPLCGGSCAIGGSATAVPFWDAGAELASKSWKNRFVWTAVDTNGNGRIERNDGTFRLEATDAAAAKVVPYLGLGTTPSGQSVCRDIANQLVGAGDPGSAALVVAPAAATAAQITAAQYECAKTIIRYVLGADVLNEMGKKAPEWPPANQDALWDREYKLGDIFHSSPVVVDPPPPREGLMCVSGLHNQCLPSLWKTPTPGGVEGYDAYSLSNRYYNRDKFILVGANDGLLHAFHAGTWRPGMDDPYTSAVNESLPPFNGHFDRGTADEIWAFAPPDQLSKLPLLMGSKHYFYVDGTSMVRDIWVDGSKNGLALASSKNDFKEGSEFHTVAITGSRRGGTRYFALDVTDAASPGSKPDFLWIYPQPNDPESLLAGESYDDFLPTPPPIGPVRVEAGGADPIVAGNTPQVNVPGVAAPVSYHEKWIAFLNGGFDPQYVRGRGVHMVDAWTGDELFDFSYPRNAASVPAGDPRLELRFPVAATVGMMAWGVDAYFTMPPTHDYFFDSAAFGDTGGQIWMTRFFAPAKRGADGRATNWFGGRAFQMGGVGSCKLCGGQPFFNISSDLPIQPQGSTKWIYRTVMGTGDRYNLLDKNGGTCGPDNIRACVMRGCTVTVDPNFNYLQNPDLGFSKSGLAEAGCAAMTNTQSDGAIATCTVDGRVRVLISGCPSSLTTTKDMAVGCNEYADGYRCDKNVHTPGEKLVISDTTNPINMGNWFLGLTMFQKSTARDLFWTAAEAKAYDAARITLNQTGKTTFTASAGLKVSAATNDAGGVASTFGDPGWAVYYDHGPTLTVSGHVYNIAWQDERTSSAAGIGPSIVTWHTTTPTQGEVISASGGACKTSKCTAESGRISFHYAADPATGLPKFTDPLTGATVRGVASYLLVPSQADQRTVFVNQEGQIAVGLTAVNPQAGSSNVGMSPATDPTSDAGFLEIDEDLHACRHAPNNPTCK